MEIGKPGARNQEKSKVNNGEYAKTKVQEQRIRNQEKSKMKSGKHVKIKVQELKSEK